MYSMNYSFNFISQSILSRWNALSSLKYTAIDVLQTKLLDDYLEIFLITMIWEKYGIKRKNLCIISMLINLKIFARILINTTDCREIIYGVRVNISQKSAYVNFHLHNSTDISRTLFTEINIRIHSSQAISHDPCLLSG